MSGTYLANLGIWRRVGVISAAAEYFTLGGKLDMDLNPNYRFIAVMHRHGSSFRIDKILLFLLVFMKGGLLTSGSPPFILLIIEYVYYFRLRYEEKSYNFPRDLCFIIGSFSLQGTLS